VEAREPTKEEMAIMDVVRLAGAAMHLRNNGDPHGQMGRIFDQLTHSLSLLPNAKADGSRSDPVQRPVEPAAQSGEKEK
jgi:hypothetical protein